MEHQISPMNSNLCIN